MLEIDRISDILRAYDKINKSLNMKKNIRNSRNILDNVKNMCGWATDKQLSAALDAMICEMSVALMSGDRVEIRGFGSFYSRKRVNHSIRNPKNGSIYEQRDLGVISFKPSKDLLSAVANQNTPPDEKNEHDHK